MPRAGAPIRRYRLLVLFLLPLLLWLSWFHFAFTGARRLSGPSIVYWAWERPEDLRSLDSNKEGVAFLARSVELLPDSVQVIPRRQPLYVPPGMPLVAVVRIYSHAEKPPALSDAQFQQTLQALFAATREPAVVALQIDYDARTSERSFYSRLLRELRLQLGTKYPISITALASWCISDRWIRDLPVDEAVPMLFSMGREEPLIRQYLSTTGRFPEPLCRGSLGISTGESWPNVVSSETRVYIFNQRSWTRDDFASVRAQLHR